MEKMMNNVINSNDFVSATDDKSSPNIVMNLHNHNFVGSADNKPNPNILNLHSQNFVGSSSSEGDKNPLEGQRMEN